MEIAKIILGAKNTDIEQLKKVVKIYALAGADIFDVCADSKIIETTHKVINGLCLNKKPLICASITLNNDKHSQKAEINNERCCDCTRCINICPQKTIVFQKDIVSVKAAGCIGCGKCAAVCPNGAINLHNINQDFKEQYMQAQTVDYIEIHTNGKDENLFDIFEFLKENFNGEIGICISQNTNTQEKIEIITRVRNIICPQKLIVQADGNSISGFDNEIKTTQKTIEECKNFRNIDGITLIASGGTNFRTNELAKTENVHIDGIAWGSFARKIIFENENATEKSKLEKAKELINTVK